MLRGTQSVVWPTFAQYCMVDRVTEAVRIPACQINGMISGQYANVEPHLHLRVSCICRQRQQLYLCYYREAVSIFFLMAIWNILIDVSLHIQYENEIL